MIPALVWTDEATDDLLYILDYIAARNPDAADRLNPAIEHAAERIPANPYVHRPGRRPDTREAIVHPNYILVYRCMRASNIHRRARQRANARC